MESLFKIFLILLVCLLSSGCTVIIMYKSNYGISNTLGQKTEATLPLVGDEMNK